MRCPALQAVFFFQEDPLLAWYTLDSQRFYCGGSVIQFKEHFSDILSSRDNERRIGHKSKILVGWLPILVSGRPSTENDFITCADIFWSHLVRCNSQGLTLYVCLVDKRTHFLHLVHSARCALKEPHSGSFMKYCLRSVSERLIRPVLILLESGMLSAMDVPS